jgi:hypothetical protein
VFVVALAAGTPAAAQPAAQQAPAKPPATPPSGTAPVAQPPATPVAGQPPAVPAAPPPAVPASRKFTSDSGVMFSIIKADKTTDFEAVLARVKEALAASQDPKRKQQALSWRVLKGLEAGPGLNTVVYVWLLDPAVKDVDYSITTILAEAFPNEAQDLWSKYTSCFVSGQTMLNLQQVLNMGPAGTVTVPK